LSRAWTRRKVVLFELRGLAQIPKIFIIFSSVSLATEFLSA
jgi:hypothetical protein